MEILVKNIFDIIIIEINTINNKVKGLNFLEILKIRAIEKLLPLINQQKSIFDQNFDIEKELEKNIFISIKYFTKPFSISKKIIEFDSLFISFNENSNFDIYQDEKKYSSISLYKNNGVSLPSSSVVTCRYNKNVLLLEVQNKNIEQTLTL